MSRLILILLLLIIYRSGGVAQTRSRLRIVEYNVENLFDTLHAVGKADADFTPGGSHRWNTPRYWGKLGRVSRTLASAGGDVPPDLVALVEVENDSVVSNLVRRTRLAKYGYEYLITHGEDPRGINVALLYLPHRFRPVSKDTVRIPVSKETLRPTRDILHVAGELTSGDTLDVFVVHFPSRRGGKAAMVYRSVAARTLRNTADSVCKARQNPYVVITGDYNGYYPEEMLTKDFGVLLPNAAPISSNSFYLLSHDIKARGDVRGTYKYKGEWNQLDQFIVSGSLLTPHASEIPEQKSTSPFTSANDCRIVDYPFLLQRDKNGQGVHPLRTYLGTYYQGGYSDHLPLVLDIWY